MVEQTGTFGAEQVAFGEGGKQVGIGMVGNRGPEPSAHDFRQIMH
jgi:hypothetical protein